MGDVLGALDLLVITSRTEGMSNTMLEALAAGLPVVSTPVSGAREALEPLTDGRRPGASCWSRSRKRWRQAWRPLLADRATLAAMGAAALVRAQERFAWQDKLARWEAVLAV